MGGAPTARTEVEGWSSWDPNREVEAYRETTVT